MEQVAVEQPALIFSDFPPALPVIPNPVRMLIMKIRSITYFADPGFTVDEQRLTAAAEFLKVAQTGFLAAGYEVQSSRLASVPFPQLLDVMNPDRLVRLAQQLEKTAANLGYAYVSLGPALPDFADSYSLIPAGLSATQNVFFSGLLTTKDGKVSLSAIHQCAQVIQTASSISKDGFANLRFAALANVPPGSPFFPAAYHMGVEPAFALATEAADLAVSAFSHAKSLEEARQNLVNAVEAHGNRLAGISRQVERQTGVRFGGIDFSLAPFPSEGISLGTAMQSLGIPALGLHGSLATAAFLADCIDQARFPRAGFSGLMFPVLEDATLAKQAAQGNLGVMDLLLYSAVCGTGLDTIPLPGDASIEQLSAVLLDLACLSSRLGKPLTARLMPIPGKQAGDPTDFNFTYFANSRVMPLRAIALGGLLGTNESFNLSARIPRQG